MRNFFSGWFRLIGNLHATSVWYIVLMFDALTQKIRWKQHLLFFRHLSTKSLPSTFQIGEQRNGQWDAGHLWHFCNFLFDLHLLTSKTFNLKTPFLFPSEFCFLFLTTVVGPWRVVRVGIHDWHCFLSEEKWADERTWLRTGSQSAHFCAFVGDQKEERMEKMPPPLSCL